MLSEGGHMGTTGGAEGAESVLEREAATEALTLWLCRDFDSCLQTLQRLESNTGGKSIQTAHNILLLSFYNGEISGQELVNQLQTLQSYAPSATTPRLEECSTRPDARLQLDDHDSGVSRLNAAVVLYNAQQYEAAAEQLQPLTNNLGSLHDEVALRVALLLTDIHLALRQPTQALASLTLLEKMTGAEEQTRVKETPASVQVHGGTAKGEAETERNGTAGTSSGGSTGVMNLPTVSHLSSKTMMVANKLLSHQSSAIPQLPDIQKLLRHYKSRVALLNRSSPVLRNEPPGGSSALPSTSCSPCIPLPEKQCTSETTLSDAISAAEVQLLEGLPEQACRGLLAVLLDGPGQLGSASGKQASDSNSLASGGPWDASSSIRTILSASSPCGGATSTQLPSADLKPLLLSNIGMAFHLSGRHQLAAVCLSQAQQSPTPCTAERMSSLTPIQSGASAFSEHSLLQECAVLYNLGLQHLLNSNFSQALPMFRRAARAGFWSQPLILLRTAESALGLYKQMKGSSAGTILSVMPASEHAAVPQAQGASKVPEEPKHLLSEAVDALGTATVLLDAMMKQAEEDSAELSASATSLSGTTSACTTGPSGSTPTDDSAIQRSNAWSSTGQADVVPDQGDCSGAECQPGSSANGQGGPEGMSSTACTASDSKAPGSHSLWLTDISKLQAHTLASLAYAHLLRGDHASALTAAQQLLSQSGLPPQNYCLAVCYAAEAMCGMGLSREAADLLAAQLPDDIRCQTNLADSRPDHSDSTTASTAATSEAGVVVGSCREDDVASTACVNLAHLLVSQGRVEEAQEVVTRVSGKAVSAATSYSARFLLVWVALMQGKHNEALERMRDASSQAGP